MKIPCDGGPLAGQLVDVQLTEGCPPPDVVAMWPTPPAYATYSDPNPELTEPKPQHHRYTLQKWACDVHGHQPLTGCPHLEHHLRYR